MEKSVLLRLIKGTQNRREVCPGISAFGIVFIKNVDFQAGGAGKIVRCFPGHKFHRFGGSGIGIGKPLGYAGVAIARPEALCKQFLIPLFQQSAIAGQDFPEIRVNAVYSRCQKFRNGSIPRILAQQPFKVFNPFRAKNRIGQGRIKQFHIVRF